METTSTIDESQRKAARIAGFASLLSFVTVVSVFLGIFTRLIIPGDAVQTARNILAHELEGLSFKQMAAETGVSINTLLSRKRYAVRHLRARLQDIYDDFMQE